MWHYFLGPLQWWNGGQAIVGSVTGVFSAVIKRKKK